MLLINLFIQGAALGLTAGAAPGPLQTYLISETMAGGWRRSLPLIFVPLISDTPIVILVTLFLGQMPDLILSVISVIGGIFVLYMAWELWQNWRASNSAAPSNPKKTPPNFNRAIAMNLLNPNPYIFWAFVSGPILLEALEKSLGHALAFLFGFYGIFLSTMGLLVMLFHLTRKLGPPVIRFIQLASILVLVIFGGVLIREGLLG